MALLNDLDDAAKEIQLKREEDKKIEDATNQAKEDTKKELEQHEKNKEQGML